MVGGIDIQNLRDTNYELENQIMQLNKDLLEKDIQLSKEKRDCTEVSFNV